MQRLVVGGFLGIKHAEVWLDRVCVIIGPQASGKSVIARLIFFFNEYFADFDEIPLMKNEHKKTYDARKREDFYKIFPQYSWQDDEFEIEYQNGEHCINVRSSRTSSTIEIVTSPSVAAYFRHLKKAFQDFTKGFPEDTRFSRSRVLREFRAQSDLNGVAKFDHALFVPAARSFYATIREEIFSILSMDEKIDRIIMQFGEFYESAKLRTSYDADRQRKEGSVYQEYFKKIAMGRFIRLDERDWIEMERGRIELSKASSGQQEVIPLLVALSHFPAPGRTLLIEEPEAHLFPTAQTSVLDFIVRQAMTRKTSIFLTTHSPYILSSLNNYILREKKGMVRGIPAERVSAYSISNGVTTSLMEDTGLVSADYIDSASDEIYEEFSRILSYEADDVSDVVSNDD